MWPELAVIAKHFSLRVSIAMCTWDIQRSNFNNVQIQKLSELFTIHLLL